MNIHYKTYIKTLAVVLYAAVALLICFESQAQPARPMSFLFGRQGAPTPAPAPAPAYAEEPIKETSAPIDPYCEKYKKDKLRHLVRRLNERGIATDFEYDELARLKKIIESRRETSFEYEPEGVVSKQTGPDGVQTSYSYTTQGWLLSQTLPSGFKIQYRYDVLGRVVYAYTQQGETTYEYQDVEGRVIVTSNGIKTSFDYDALGQIIRYEDAQGGVYSFKYNGLGDVVEAVNPANELTRYSYDYTKNLRIKTMPSGATEHCTFDGLGRPKVIAVFDPAGAVVETKTYDYTLAGYIIEEYQGSEAKTECIRSVFNEKGQLISRRIQTHEKSFVDEVFKYDEIGNLVQYTDFEGNVYTYEYDVHDQLVKETSPDGSVISHEYNIIGQRVRTHFPKGVTVHYEYDKLTGEKTREKMVCGDVEDSAYVLEYDPQSRLVRKHDPRGIDFDYEYDAFGRVIGVVSSSGDALKYTYNANGDVTEIKQTSKEDIEITVSRQYDALGQLTSETIAMDGAEHQSATQSWSNGMRTGFAITAQGHTHSIGHVHNVAGRLQQVSCADINYKLEYTYNESGQMLQWVDGFATREVESYSIGGFYPEIVTTYNIDNAPDLEEILFWKSPVELECHLVSNSYWISLNQFEYKYDTLGRLTKQTGGIYSKNDNAQYSYDELGVLQRKSTCDEGICSDYRVRKQWGNKVNAECLEEGVTADGCADESLEGFRRTYDEAGNLVGLYKDATNEHWQLSWNAWGELERVSCVGKFEWTAVYDGLGRRLMTIYHEDGKPAQVVKSYYDPEVEFLEIGVSRGDDIAWKIYGIDSNGVYGGLQGIGGLQAIVNGCTNEIVKPLQDVQGNILGYLNCAGAQWKRVSFDAYGPIVPGIEDTLESLDCRIPIEEAVAKAHTWRGKRTDPTGLIWMGSRYYDASAGRFISPDPYGHEGSLDLYSYANGNPVIYCDPDGRFFSAVYESGKNFIPFEESSKLLFEGLWGADQKTGQELPVLDRGLRLGVGGMGAIIDMFSFGKGSIFVKSAANIANSVARAAAMKMVNFKRSRAANDIWKAREMMASRFPLINDRNRIIRAFELETFRVKTLANDVTDYRYYDNVFSKIEGRWSTPHWIENIEQRAQMMALPHNAGTQAAKVYLRKGTTVFEGTVAPQLQYGSHLTGGGYQRYHMYGPRAVFETIEK